MSAALFDIFVITVLVGYESSSTKASTTISLMSLLVVGYVQHLFVYDRERTFLTEHVFL